MAPSSEGSRRKVAALGAAIAAFIGLGGAVANLSGYSLRDLGKVIGIPPASPTSGALGSPSSSSSPRRSTLTPSSPAPPPVAPAFLDNLILADGQTPSQRGLLSLHGVPFPESVGYTVGFAVPFKATTYNVRGEYSSLTATMGVSEPSCPGGSHAQFEVQADGKSVVNQRVTDAQDVPISVSIAGAHQLRISVDWGNNLCSALGVWGNAQVKP